MVELRLPDRMVHFHPEDSLLNPNRPSVLGDRGADGGLPPGKSFGLANAFTQARVSALDLAQDIKKAVEGDG